jgi:hypothetical protein
MFTFTTETSAPANISFRTTVHKNTLSWLRVQRVCAAGSIGACSPQSSAPLILTGSSFGDPATGHPKAAVSAAICSTGVSSSGAQWLSRTKTARGAQLVSVASR